MTSYPGTGLLDYIQPIVDMVGTLFGIRSVGGYRPMGPGEFANEHPSRKAADFMTDSKTQGDALAAYLVANASTLGVQEVIWYRRIWTPAKGWHTYEAGATTSDPSTAHTNHVHGLLGGAAPTTATIQKLAAGGGAASIDGAAQLGAGGPLFDVDRLISRAQDSGLMLAGVLLGLALVAAGAMVSVRPIVKRTESTARKAVIGG